MEIVLKMESGPDFDSTGLIDAVNETLYALVGDGILADDWSWSENVRVKVAPRRV